MEANKSLSAKLAVQMFTLREFTKTASDLAETLRRVREIGYTAVQLSAVGAMSGDDPKVDAKLARQMLDDYGLSCIATHRPWERLINQTHAEIEFHHILGCDYIAIGGISNDDYTYATYRKFVREAEELIGKLKPFGLRFGHHNHSREFFRPESGGVTLEDILIDEASPELMLELDLYWIEHAGLNSVRILERCPGRVPVIHLKDKEVIKGENDTRMAPIGEGTMDWPAIVEACEIAGVDWYCVEQDRCFRDPFDCVKSSFDYLSSLFLR